ncbi:MAG TPA: hypothetical protein VF088_01940 [Pyrinomonadaceae bacterium]
MKKKIKPPAPYILIMAVLTVCFSSVPGFVQSSDRQDLNFEVKHRVNAHGDEFNGLARSSDGKRLFVGTEKGEVIVWNIALRRTERTLRQASAVHLVASLPDTNEVLAAGANHHKPVHALLRKWNIETEAFVDLSGLDGDSFPTALATGNELAAVTTAEGAVLVWNLATNKQLATWKLEEAPIALALIGRDIYVATIDREALLSDQGPHRSRIIKLNVDNPKSGPIEFLHAPDRSWTTLSASPDHRLLAATFDGEQGERTLIIDPASKSEIGNFQGSASVWIDSSQLMLFKWLDPSEIVQIPRSGPAKAVRQLERMQADTEGRAFDLTGQVTNVDGSQVWASYRQGPGLLEFDLASKKIKTLIEGRSGAYAISVVEQDSDGKLLTGGADGYVRLWNLVDIFLIKEFRVAAPGYFVTDVDLLPDARSAIIGVMRIRKRMEQPVVDPLQVFLLDLQTGQQKKILDVYSWQARIAVVDGQVVYADEDRIKLAPIDTPQNTRELLVSSLVINTALSANRRWLAVADEKKNLSVFDLKTLQKKSIAIEPEHLGTFVITNDGGYVYGIANEGELTKWNINTGQTSQSVLSQIRDRSSRVDFMTLSHDDQWLVTAGNHGDVGIFDRETGRLLAYTRTSAAAFYVEKVWTNGNRMIFTTDTGVMFDGILSAGKN